MTAYLNRWLRICLFNLFLVAVLGTLLRYKIAFSLPMLDQKFLLHSHSHFAFSGWVTQALMVLMVYYLATKIDTGIFAKYTPVLYTNLLISYGMMISFIFQGYGAFSITFSTLSIFVFLWFALICWKDLNRISAKGSAANIAHLWFKASLVFGLISSLGVMSLAYVMVNKISDQNWYLGSVYFFLHFQYNGWFLFAGFGLYSEKLEQRGAEIKSLSRAFLLFALACAPAYLLSVLWLSFPPVVFVLLILVVVAQLYGWILILRAAWQTRDFLGAKVTSFGYRVLLLAAVAFSIKLILQTASVHPELSQLSYGFRPIIIGYLHLVLLGVTSIFILGYILSLHLIRISRTLKAGVVVFLAGVILNELLLMWQGIKALDYTGVPDIQIYLFAAAIVLMGGSGMIFTGTYRKAD